MITIITGDYNSIKECKVLNKRFDYYITSYYDEFTKDVAEVIPSTHIVDRPGVLLTESEQYEIGFMLCELSNGITLFTQSSDLINGVRVSVKQGLCHPNNVLVMYYTPNGKYIELKMNHQGRFDKHFPDGFMDTWDKALEELLDD